MKQNSKSEILSSEALVLHSSPTTEREILSPKATDGRRTGSRSIALRRTDVNLPDYAIQADPKPILLASLTSLPTKDASIMTDVKVGGKLETGDSKLATRTPKLVTQMAKPGEQSNHQYTIVNSKSASGVDPQYEYDLNGNKTRMITPFGDWTYTYDTLDRVTSIINPNNETTTFTYDAISRRTSMTYDNGVVTSYTYDAASRLTNLITQDSQLNTLNSYTYTYDEVGNRLSMTDNDGTHNYVYSDVYRLVNATHPQIFNPDEAFTYDPVGNRLTSHLSTAYVYDNLNRLLEDDDYTYTYDNNGNLLSKVDKVSNDTTTYQYDGDDRLVQVETATDIVYYQYDGFGRRIAKTVNGVVTKYVYDREDILFELDENNQIKARYTHGPGIDEPISVDRDTNGDGAFDVTYYYQYDGLGSVSAITDTSGNVTQTYVYDTFGNIAQQTGSVENSYTFTAREWDAEAGLYFYRARHYDPTLGRFINGDPIGFKGGDVNFYVYVQNNPVNWLDPYGLWKGLPLLQGRGPSLHHDRNMYQSCPKKEPKGGNNNVDWYYEGTSSAHGGHKSYRGRGIYKGFQCVYDECGKLIDTGEDAGSYDYFPPYNDGTWDLLAFQYHLYFDIIPWALFGN